MPRLFAFLAAILVSALAVSSACVAAVDNNLHFRLEPGRERAGRIHASFSSNDGRGRHNDWSTDFAPTELIGLDAAAFGSAGNGPLRFAVVREAGRLDCTGTGGYATASGRCNFTPDANFTAYLTSRGMRRPTKDEAFAMMAVNVRRDILEGLSTARYPTPTADNLIALTAVGVSAAYIQGLAQAGYRPRDLDTLLQFKALDITPEFIRGYVRLGYGTIPTDQLVQLKALDISADYVAGFQRLGYGRVQVDDLVQLKALGITPEWVAGFQRIGYRKIAVDQLVQMKALGVTTDYVRAVQESTSELPSPHRLVQLRAVGFNPRR